MEGFLGFPSAQEWGNKVSSLLGDGGRGNQV